LLFAICNLFNFFAIFFCHFLPFSAIFFLYFSVFHYVITNKTPDGSPDEHLVSVSTDGTMRVWHIGTPRCVLSHWLGSPTIAVTATATASASATATATATASASATATATATGRVYTGGVDNAIRGFQISEAKTVRGTMFL
jgi:hypothetical protein